MRPLTLFLCVSVIWGLTWIPIKIGVSHVPPMLFASVRGLAAGSLLLFIAWRRAGTISIERGLRQRLVWVALLTYALTYCLLFWGMVRVDSGIAAVVNLSLMPTCLLFIGALFGEDRISVRKLVSTAVGVAGLVILYSSEVENGSSEVLSLGLVAVALSTVAYALGVVNSRALLRSASPVLIAGWTQLLGATMLLVASLAVESGTANGLVALTEPKVFASWLFLVIFGSVVAFTGYLRLTHLWSPHRAGLYAFVSPVIAVLAGIAFLDESLSRIQITGMGLMLAGAAIALLGRRT